MKPKGKSQKAKKQVFKQVEPAQIERCWICGGTDYKKIKIYPDYKYCPKCGLKMGYMNYDAVPQVREGMCKLNGKLELMDVTGEWTCTGEELYQMMAETVNAINKLFNNGMNPRGTDLTENFNRAQEYLREMREEARKNNVVPFPKKA